jgi:hypothetical protein
MREQPNQSDALTATLIGVRADGLSGLRSDSFWMKHPNRSDAPTPENFDHPPPKGKPHQEREIAKAASAASGIGNMISIAIARGFSLLSFNSFKMNHPNRSHALLADPEASENLAGSSQGITVPGRQRPIRASKQHELTPEHRDFGCFANKPSKATCSLTEQVELGLDTVSPTASRTPRDKIMDQITCPRGGQVILPTPSNERLSSLFQHGTGWSSIASVKGEIPKPGV